MTEQTFTAANNILSSVEGDAVMSHAQVLYNLRDFLPDMEASASALHAFGKMAGKTLTSGEISTYHKHIEHIGEMLSDGVLRVEDTSDEIHDRADYEISRVLNALSQLLPKEETA